MTSKGRHRGDEKVELDGEPNGENQRQPFLPRGFIHHGRFLDRSKVRILLCDGDDKSSREVSQLLCDCSYQVISVRTARQVIDELNAHGSEIDIILSEIDLPSSKMFKMLRRIMGMKELRHIPIVMMSAKDEVSLVVKCLRLGVADFLVKPLRRNEMLNLWIHMWRRRRMLDLPEKDMWGADVDVPVSDPSDGNSNSTLLSDDMDDGSTAALPKNEEFDAKVKDQYPVVESDKMPQNEIDIRNQDDCASGKISSCPTKNELKVAKSSAFLTYVKSTSQQMKTSSHVPTLKELKIDEKTHVGGPRSNTEAETGLTQMATFPPPTEMNNRASADVAAPYLLPGMLTRNPGNPLCPSVYRQAPIAPSFPYYHHVAPHLWTSMPCSSSSERRNGRVEREAALLKFRQKRKERCFAKKIRYVNRKRLAERRPRVKGQFVRQPNAMSSDFNEDDEDDEEDDDDGNDNDDIGEEGSTVK